MLLKRNLYKVLVNYLMRLLFISTHNFATNPRLVKEITLAIENNFEVSVLCCSFDNWSKKNNEEIKRNLLPHITYYEIPGNRKPFYPWLLSSYWFSLSKIMLWFSPINDRLLSLSSNKRSWLLLREIKKIKEKIDLVVAHNPGSFYPAMKFAKKRKIPFGVDLEDYHPGETNDEKESQYLKSLLKSVLPKATYIIAASPMILEETQKVDGQFPCKTGIVLNFFSGREFVGPVNSNFDKLKLVWFSQNISFNRGLEQVIPAMKNNQGIELHLYGNCNDQFKKEWIQGIENIFIHDSLPQIELHQFLSIYDVGLAMEPGKDLNNELAVSNKILAYFQAGLYIVASKTKAQQKFIEDYPGCGELVLPDIIYLKKVFEKLFDGKDMIRHTAPLRYENAKKNSWETESQKLLKMWRQVLS